MKLRTSLRARLSANRWSHTLAVTRLARTLAEKHGLNPEQAALAGLLHDCGRGLRLEKMPAYAVKHRLPVPLKDQVIRKAPILLHAYISADLAKKKFGVSDPEVLAAIQDHTLGRPKMGPLSRLIFIADISSEDREFSEAKKIRSLAFKNLDKAFRLAVRTKRGYVLRNGGWVHPILHRLSAWAARARL